MTTISGLPSTASALVNIPAATPKPSTPTNAAGQSTGSSAGDSTAQAANGVATAEAAAANSAGYRFATVAQNAFTTIDANIQKTGITPGNSTTSAQWNQIFGDMDRRSLYAVASNEGGKFTKQEQQAAS